MNWDRVYTEVYCADAEAALCGFWRRHSALHADSVITCVADGGDVIVSEIIAPDCDRPQSRLVRSVVSSQLLREIDTHRENFFAKRSGTCVRPFQFHTFVIVAK